MDSWGKSRGRRLNLDLDLNCPPPLDLSLELSNYSNTTDQEVEALNAARELSPIPSRAHAEARENSERSHSHGMRARLHEFTGILGGSTAAATLCTNRKARIPDPSDTKETSVSAPSPEEPTISCPICLGPLIEPTTTRCGHIFCKECIVRSLKSFEDKCPTCRKKVGKRSIFRVYLPTAN